MPVPAWPSSVTKSMSGFISRLSAKFCSRLRAVMFQIAFLWWAKSRRVCRTAVRLCAGGSVDALARYFEYWLLRLEGVYPALDVCPRCGRAALGAGAVLVLAERTYVCVDCAHGGLVVSATAMKFLRDAGRQTPAAVGKAGADARALAELERAHDRLIAMHLEKELRSARVVRELRPVL